MRLHLLTPKFVRALESDAKVQARFHQRMTWYWLINFPIVGYLFFFQPREWVSIGLILNTFYSLYANFATDFGSLSAAQASMKADSPDKPLELPPTPGVG